MKKKHRLSWKSLLSYISSVSCHGIASWLYCQSFLNAPILVQLSRRRQNYMIMLHFTHSKVYVDDTASKIRITQRIPSVMNNLDIHEDQYNFHNFSLSDSCVKCSFWKLAFNRLAIFAWLLYHVTRCDMHVTVHFCHLTHVYVLRASYKSLACPCRSGELHVTFELYGGRGMSSFTRQLPITAL